MFFRINNIRDRDGQIGVDAEVCTNETVAIDVNGDIVSGQPHLDHEAVRQLVLRRIARELKAVEPRTIPRLRELLAGKSCDLNEREMDE